MLKRTLSTSLARSVVNPVVRAALDRGIAPRGYALLETTGRRTGLPRRTPVGNGTDGDTFWIVAEHGRSAAYVLNIEADPRVRLKVGKRWRSGTAVVLPNDDPRQRQRTIGRRFNAAVVRLMGTDLLTVRIDLDETTIGPGAPRSRRTGSERPNGPGPCSPTSQRLSPPVRPGSSPPHIHSGHRLMAPSEEDENHDSDVDPGSWQRAARPAACRSGRRSGPGGLGVVRLRRTRRRQRRW